MRRSGVPSRFLGRLRRLVGAGKIGRRLLTMVSGGVGGQLILALAAPLLTRLYDPAAFGIFGVISGIALVLGPLAHGGFNQAIVVVRRQGEALNLLALCVLSVVFWTVLTSGVLLFAGEALARALDLMAAPWLLWLLPLEILILALALALEFWVLRHNRFGLAAMALGLRSVGQLAVQLISFPLAAGAGLVLGYVAGDLVRLLCLLPLDLEELKRLRRQVRWRRILAMSRRHRAYLVFNTPAVFLQNLNRMLPMTCLALFYGATAAGLYALVQKILMLPAQLVANAAAKVAVVELVQRERRHHPTLVRKIVVTSLLWNSLAFLPVLLFGGPIFAMVFGESWREAGLYAAWLVPFAVLRFANLALSQTLNIYARQDVNLLWSLTAFLSSASMLGLAIALGWEPIVLVAVHGLVAAAVQGGHLLATWRVVNDSRKIEVIWGMGNNSGGKGR